MGNNKRRGFFYFKTMITGPFLTVVYLIGFIGINVGFLGGVIAILFGNYEGFLQKQFFPLFGRYLGTPFKLVLLWVIFCFIAHFVWRLFCEGIIIIFRIYEMLVSIDRKLTTRETGIEEASPPTQKIRSRKDYEKWKDERLHSRLSKQDEGREGE
jgi:hypothetical protein